MSVRSPARLVALIVFLALALLSVSCSVSDTSLQVSAPANTTATAEPIAVATQTPTAVTQASPAVASPVVAQVTVGTLAPDFTLSDLDGAQRSLSSYRGQVVMLNFWASWCGHCRSEIPALKAVYEEYREKGFEIVAVSIGEDPTELASFVQQNGMEFTVLTDPLTSIIPLYQLRSVPTSYFLDEQGVVQQVYNGAIAQETLQGIVDQMLGQ
ncbi:MAG: redoxin domain-containing protein [Anaerolineae bacterium]